MREDDSGTSNLIAFPGAPTTNEPADDAPASIHRDRDLIRRLEAIATTIGVPVAAFLGTAQERADVRTQETGRGPQAQSAELLRLFGRISDGTTRDQCLALLRMLAAGGAEPSR